MINERCVTVQLHRRGYVCVSVCGGGGDEYCYENRDRIGGEGVVQRLGTGIF